MNSSKKGLCPICEKERVFIEDCQSKEMFICSHCGFRSDFQKTKLIVTRFGYEFVLNFEK